MLEPKRGREPLEQPVLLAEDLDAVRAGGETERDHLAPDHREQGAGDHRVEVPRAGRRR